MSKKIIEKIKKHLKSRIKILRETEKKYDYALTINKEPKEKSKILIAQQPFNLIRIELEYILKEIENG